MRVALAGHRAGDYQSSILDDASHCSLLAGAMPSRRRLTVGFQDQVELADMMLRMPEAVEQELPSLDRVPWHWAGRRQIVLGEIRQNGLGALAHLVEVLEQRGLRVGFPSGLRLEVPCVLSMTWRRGEIRFPSMEVKIEKEDRMVGQALELRPT